MTKILAHRGASGYAPENTLEAFALAAELGADGVELDVHLTADGEMVVIHDETVDRTTDGSGLVCRMTLAELKKLNARNGMGGLKHCCRIPTLREVYELLKPTPLMINVEIKTDAMLYDGICEKLTALEHEMGMEGRLIYSSFNHNTILEMKRVNPGARTGLLYIEALANPWAYAESIGADALHPDKFAPLTYPEHMRIAAEHGIETNTWTVNTVEDMESLIRNGASAIITNYPTLALAVRKRIEDEK